MAPNLVGSSSVALSVGLSLPSRILLSRGILINCKVARVLPLTVYAAFLQISYAAESLGEDCHGSFLPLPPARPLIRPTFAPVNDFCKSSAEVHVECSYDLISMVDCNLP